MGRRAGVTAEETRQELLAAASTIFARKGYDGASVSDIAREANLSTGTIYLHFENKAELFVATVRELAQREAAELIGVQDMSDLTTADQSEAGMYAFVRTVSESLLAHRDERNSALLLEAIIAADRHPEVAELVSSWVQQGEGLIALIVGQGQRQGLLDPDFDPAAAARLVTLLTLGGRMAGGLRDLPEIDSRGWSDFMLRLVSSLRAPQLQDL